MVRRRIRREGLHASRRAARRRGTRRGGRNFDDTIFKTNLEAAQVIARQLRMRTLGGIIIIDFIDMELSDHRAAVLGELDKALEKDRTRLTVNGFTQLGLVEMRRKRTRESLAHVLCETCPSCHGRGELKTAQTICSSPSRSHCRSRRSTHGSSTTLR
jgi:ribonuclease G